jgi:hypothetical protein
MVTQLEQRLPDHLQDCFVTLGEPISLARGISFG